MNYIKNIFSNWTFRRFLFLLGGLFFLALAIKDQIWWVAIFGIYYCAMAIFGFGCAGGNCEIKNEQKHE